MAVNVCPADRVQASVELVWELLMQPAGYGRFWDLTVERVEPEGPAAAGQKFAGWTRALPAVAGRGRVPGGGRGAAPDPVPHGPPARDRRRQPDRVHADRRGQLHAPLRVRFLVPARVAGPTAGAHGRALSRERRGLAAAPEASG